MRYLERIGYIGRRLPLVAGPLLAAGLLMAAGATDVNAVRHYAQAAPVSQTPPATPQDTAAPVEQADTIALPAVTAAAVVLDRDTLFWLRRPLGPFSAQQRAAATRERLLELARNPFARLDSLRIADEDGRSDVMLRDLVLTTVTDADAAAEGVTRAALARTRAESIAAALERSALSTNLRTVLVGIVYTLIATAALLLLLRLMNHAFPRLRRLVGQWRNTRIRALRVQNVEFVSADRIVGLLTGVITITRFVLTALLLYLYLLLAFSFFPWTRGVARRLISYAIEPVVSAFNGFINFLPDLFYIVVIVLVTRYVLKLIRMVFDGIASGAITFAGFYRDWADPTYKIVRFLVLALSVILIWPYLPSSERPEFRGVAAFLALLLSLGSASAVANVVSGVVMVYMRPFQIGDRVKIADTIGDVVEKTLLVTRVRTTKNVDITVPNSLVLGSHIINYSSTAHDHGLILHTTVTIGYDVPWRRVHDTLIAAALHTDSVLKEPQPFVLQTALNDYHVAYELNAYTANPGRMARTYSTLHESIQDHFARAGIEILSPSYESHRDGSPSTIPDVDGP